MGEVLVTGSEEALEAVMLVETSVTLGEGAFILEVMGEVVMINGRRTLVNAIMTSITVLVKVPEVKTLDLVVVERVRSIPRLEC